MRFGCLSYHSVDEVGRVCVYSHTVRCCATYYASLDVFRGLLVLIKPDQRTDVTLFDCFAISAEELILLCVIVPCFLVFVKGVERCAGCADVFESLHVVGCLLSGLHVLASLVLLALFFFVDLLGLPLCVHFLAR